MLFITKEILLKNQQKCLFRSPEAGDAEEMIAFLKACASETDFILRYPEECVETIEQEEKYLANINGSETGVLIVCEVEGKIAGNCQLNFHKRMKTKHRASVAIALMKQYWDMGIGTAMFTEMIAIARSHGITQLELEVIEGNERAIHLYEKMGFQTVACMPNAIRLRDGTMLKEFTMIKEL